MRNAFILWTTVLFLTFGPSYSLAADANSQSFTGRICSVVLGAIAHPIRTVTGRLSKPAAKSIAIDEASIPETVVLDKERGLTLSKDQYLALYKAQASGEYDVKYAHANIDGKERLVVLLGESHVKKAGAGVLGKDVVNQFPVRGLEGADFSKTWGGKLLGFTLDLMYGLGRLNPLKRMHKTSTIDDAHKVPREQLLIQVALAINENIEKGNIKEGDLTTGKISVGDITFEGEEIAKALAKVRLFLKDPETFKAERAKNAEKEGGKPKTQFVQVIPLEKDHVPDLKENLASLYIPSMVTACAAGLCVSLLESAGVPGMSHVESTTIPLFYGLAPYAVFGPKVANRWIPRTTGWHYILNPIAAIGRNRSKTMASNVNKALIDNNDINTMLVVVGKEHVPEIIEFLDSNYKSGDLPTPDSLSNSVQKPSAPEALPGLQPARAGIQ